jgi:hypothetical protein
MTANEQGTYTIMHEGYHSNISGSETMMHKPANEEGLLYSPVYMQFVNIAQWFVK